ncbi:MAG TPA: oxidoreductase [Verrucomicrobiales bacterium]|nr:oxidoreductase [Verrucomicrobiales bacterium]
MPTRFQINRRSFLKRSSLTAAAAGLPLWFVQRDLALAADQAARVPGSANDRPGLALIGCGGMGSADLRAASQFGDVIAVCDVKENSVASAIKSFTKDGKVPVGYGDFRQVLEREDVHVIVNGTPDHWHSLINIGAARAKKDIYGEKPLTLTVDEGKHVVKAVRDNGVVFQTGTQQRSDRRFRLACELVRNGRGGKLQTVEVFLPAGLREGPFATDQVVPPGLNWDMWLGQAPNVPYQKERAGNSFRWWWDYAGGPVTDWGAHHNDIARWAIGQEGPIAVEARETVGPIAGGYTTCKEFEATLEYAGGIRQIVKTTTADSPFGGIIDPDGQRNGVRFTGTDGWIWVNRRDLNASRDELYLEPLPDNAIRLERSDHHMTNFFDCVRSRQDPVAKVEFGHRSAVVGHLIIIAMWVGRKLLWDPVREVFTGDGAAEANKHLAREMRKPYDYSYVG